MATIDETVESRWDAAHAAKLAGDEVALLLYRSNLLGADCYYVSAPVYTSDPATRDSLMAQRGLKDLFARAAKADLAVVSVGAMGGRATIPDLGLVEPGVLDELRGAGAVGDLLGHYLDTQGRLVAHPLNRCVMAMAPEELAKLPNCGTSPSVVV